MDIVFYLHVLFHLIAPTEVPPSHLIPCYHHHLFCFESSVGKQTIRKVGGSLQRVQIGGNTMEQNSKPDEVCVIPEWDHQGRKRKECPEWLRTRVEEWVSKRQDSVFACLHAQKY